MKNNLFNKLRKIIKYNSLKTEDFLFYPSICPKDIDDRSKYFSNKLSKRKKDEADAQEELVKQQKQAKERNRARQRRKKN